MATIFPSVVFPHIFFLSFLFFLFGEWNSCVSGNFKLSPRVSSSQCETWSSSGAAWWRMTGGSVCIGQLTHVKLCMKERGHGWRSNAQEPICWFDEGSKTPNFDWLQPLDSRRCLRMFVVRICWWCGRGRTFMPEWGGETCRRREEKYRLFSCAAQKSPRMSSLRYLTTRPQLIASVCVCVCDMRHQWLGRMKDWASPLCLTAHVTESVNVKWLKLIKLRCEVWTCAGSEKCGQTPTFLSRVQFCFDLWRTQTFRAQTVKSQTK